MTKASYSGTTTSGVLTVTSGSEVAKIHLLGNYLASAWTLSSDGHGGTKIVDPTKATSAAVAAPHPVAPAPDRFVQAMAGFGAATGGPAVPIAAEALRAPALMLASRMAPAA